MARLRLAGFRLPASGFRRLGALVALAWTLMLGACVTGPASKPVVGGPPVTLALVQDGPETSGPVARDAREAIAEVLAHEGYGTEWAGEDGLLPALVRHRAGAPRIRAMGNLETPGPRILIELAPRFFSQMNGRYRWSVSVHVTAWVGKTRVTRETTDPAFLRFDHEREDAAVAALTDAIGALAVEALDEALVAGEGDEAVPVDEVSTPAAAPRRALLVPGAKNAETDALKRVTGELAPDTDNSTKSTKEPSKGPLGAQNSTKSTTEAPGMVPRLLYFVMIDRFANGEPENDGDDADPSDPAGWHGGDLPGLEKKLDWFRQLGVSHLWLSPLYESRREKLGEHGAFHGYWVKTHSWHDDHFATDLELDRFAAAARDAGIGLVLDTVVNHVGYDSPLTRSHPEWFHGKGDITDWNDPEQLTTHDVHGLPDLALEKEGAMQYVAGATRLQVDRMKATGIRLDAVKHVPLAQWADFNDRVEKALGREVWNLGEDLDGDPARLVKTLKDGHFDAVFDFPLYFAMVDVFCKGAPPAKLAAVLSLDRLYDDPNTQLVTLLDNHDLPRLATACGGHRAAISNALTALFSLRGIPSLTWGTEVGLEGEGEPQNRGDMVFDVDHPLKKQLEALARQRQARPALGRGTTQILEVGPRHLVLLREADGDRALVVFAETGGIKALPGVGVDTWDRGLNLYTPPEDWRSPLAGEPQTRTVRFSVSGGPKGATLAVVGAGPELGHWKPARALAVKDGVATVEVPVGTVLEFKLVSTGGEAPVWDGGSNEYLFVAPDEGELPVELEWQGPA